MGLEILASALAGAFGNLQQGNQRRREEGREDKLFEMQRMRFALDVQNAEFARREAEFRMEEARKRGARDDELFPLQKQAAAAEAQLRSLQAQDEQEFGRARSLMDMQSKELGMERDRAAIASSRASTAYTSALAGDLSERRGRESSQNRIASLERAADTYETIRSGIPESERNELDVIQTKIYSGADVSPEEESYFREAMTELVDVPVEGAGPARQTSPRGVIEKRDALQQALEDAVKNDEEYIDLVHNIEDETLRQQYMEDSDYKEAIDRVAAARGITPPNEEAAAATGDAPERSLMGEIFGETLSATPASVGNEVLDLFGMEGIAADNQAKRNQSTMFELNGEQVTIPPEMAHPYSLRDDVNIPGALVGGAVLGGLGSKLAPAAKGAMEKLFGMVPRMPKGAVGGGPIRGLAPVSSRGAAPSPMQSTFRPPPPPPSSVSAGSLHNPAQSFMPPPVQGGGGIPAGALHGPSRFSVPSSPPVPLGLPGPQQPGGFLPLPGQTPINLPGRIGAPPPNPEEHLRRIIELLAQGLNANRL